jgi:hypothetical protein
VFLTIRRVDDATSYLARVRFDTAHTAWLQAGRTVGASTQMLGSEARVPEFTHAPSSALWVRAAAAGDAPTTLGLKAWPDGRPEPESWQYAGSDSEASLRAAGAVALQTYVSSRTTNAPVTFRFSQFSVAPADPTTLAISAVAFPTPTAEPRATLATPTPAPAPTPSVDQAWTALQTDLEAAWGTDTPRTIALLDAFLTRFPGHAAAREKLYAALVSSAADLSSAGEPDRAAQRLEQARDLIPSRGEALAALAGLTPTPVPVPVHLQPAPAVVQPNQPPAPPVARGPVSTRASAPAPAPASRVSSVRPPAPPPARPAAPAAAQPAAPTPTKVPFVPPRIGP